MLTVRDLVKIYPGPVAALQGVDLDIPNGMFGLLGSNGAGKTTLMRILAGLLEPTSGNAALDGESILDRPETIWSRLGYLPQDFGFFPHLTGTAMLSYLLRLKGVTAPGGLNALCDELLEQVNLSFTDDFYEGQTDSFVGTRSPLTTRVKITGPAEFTLNSVGIKTADTEDAGRRTVVWESDHPVSFFNVVAGRWDVKRGAGTAVFYHPGHPYNVDEILGCLDSSRKYYSQWFLAYPWKELKLSEFPALATYAQGFPTNISFSEGVGFLTASTPEIHFAFEITAHEAAHQWWGNILTPGKGPGGNILAEGMAHFSTILLVDQAKGPGARIDFCKRLEANYAKSRRPDAERPLVKIDGSRSGDTTVTYDRGAGSSGCC